MSARAIKALLVISSVAPLEALNASVRRDQPEPFLTCVVHLPLREKQEVFTVWMYVQ